MIAHQQLVSYDLPLRLPIQLSASHVECPHRKSRDGGIDGVIRQDKLGLDVVCIQAKRWDGPVGRPVIQGFVGSMDYIRAKKGVILTTSTCTKDAIDYVERIEGKKVVLINGDQLADLMIDHGLGVTTTKTYEIREVSNDFFDESEI
jgi:restriction system protein